MEFKATINEFMPAFPLDIADTCFTCTRTVDWHDHEFYEFFFVRSGTLIHHLNGTRAVLPERTLVFIRPEDRHTFQVQGPRKQSVITNCSFTSEMFEKTVNSLPEEYRRKLLSDEPRHRQIEPALWRNLLTKVELLCQTEPFASDRTLLYFQGLLYDVVLALIATDDAAPLPAWLDNACAAMQEPENFIAGLPRFIELCGRSQEHLNRSLKKLIGETPTEMINRLRVRHAARLLTTTSRSVTDILFDCGFENIAWFNRLFRRQFGMSPRDYRRRNHRIFQPS